MTMNSSDTNGPTHRMVEAGVTSLIGLFGAITVYGSIKAGINWGAEGPKAGFFPFYVGIAIIISSIINLRDLLTAESTGVFAEWGQLRRVLSVVIPIGIYVGTMPALGLYLTSALFIGWFMRWLGKYKWPLVLALSLGTPIFTYIVFERWFMVPLPKGPIEDWLGL